MQHIINRRWSLNVGLLCNSDAMRKAGKLSWYMWLREPIKSFTIQIFYSEATSMWNIPPETLRLFHLHVYCGLCLLLILHVICIFKLAAVWGFSSLLCLEKSYYSLLQTIKWLLFSLFSFLSFSGVFVFLLLSLPCLHSFPLFLLNVGRSVALLP